MALGLGVDAADFPGARQSGSRIERAENVYGVMILVPMGAEYFLKYFEQLEAKVR